jgi:tRNA dimethylallyltransferase
MHSGISNQKAILLMGPTASGKSHLAMSLAESGLPVEIVSVDSAQIYRGMNIGTAKPTMQEQQSLPHHLIDILDPTEIYSVAQFCEDAFRVMKDIVDRGKIPLCVGGTMMYFKALREGLSQLPPSQPEVRHFYLSLLEKKGLAFLYQKLEEQDPEGAARLKPTDTQRVLRALEIIKITGQLYSVLINSPREEKGSWQFLPLAIEPQDRKQLHQDIHQRFLTMLSNGFLDEVRQLCQYFSFTIDHIDKYPSLRTVGYRQAMFFLEGKIDYLTFIDESVAATRQLAKRQITWLRADESRQSVLQSASKQLDKHTLLKIKTDIENFLSASCC